MSTDTHRLPVSALSITGKGSSLFGDNKVWVSAPVAENKLSTITNTRSRNNCTLSSEEFSSLAPDPLEAVSRDPYPICKSIEMHRQ